MNVRLWLPAACLIPLACALPGPDTAPEPAAMPHTPPPAPPEQVTVATQALASVMGGIEAGIDAPWRLEPIGADIDARSNIYPPIPLVISVHDASLQRDPETRVPLGQFCGVSINEAWNDGQVHYDLFDHGPYPKQWFLNRDIPASSPLIREIERSDKWPYNSGMAANHRLCRRWAGENCNGVLDVGSSAEWHATVEYHPQQYVVGGTIASDISPYRHHDSVFLTVTARFARAGRSCDDHPWSITDKLAILLGDALPRFEGGWVYGDLHYHSQGTDNEGESAYAYRPTLQAMRAMGLDFVFATDHASDSGQVTDIDYLYIDKRIDVWYVPDFLEDLAFDFIEKVKVGITSNTSAARDMSFPRFAAMHQWINRPGNGANADALRAFPGGPLVPRIFLGGEVDVIPEMSTEERNTGSLMYGNGQVYRWGRACSDVPDQIKTIDEWTTFNICESAYDLTEPAAEGGRYLLKDIQGVGDQWFARQHMVFLPTDGTRADHFVSSRTQLFGGANERLKDILSPTHWNTMVGKGVAFLAHPVDAARGNGMGRLGPDIVPYSDVQLRTAFNSPAILGLQLWNEDSRLESNPDAFGFPYAGREYGRWLGAQPRSAYRDLHDGVFAWDKMLQWGIRRSQTAGLSWLPSGMPRRVLMAGGSDAHGDWNYRREGRLDGLSGVVDTAIGKPRNLLFVGEPGPDTVQDEQGTAVPALNQTQVTTALASGQFMVTDGPALRIAIDRNGNGVIDSTDTAMGGVGEFTAGSTIPVIIEWKSTPEFQLVSSIDIYVGVASDGIDASLVYAPVNHGVHAPETPSGALSPNIYREPGGAEHRRLHDGYMADPTGLLRIVPTSTDNIYWRGRRVVQLPVDSFLVGRLREQPGVQPEPVCRPNVWCRKPGFSEKCEIECNNPPTPPSTYHFDSPSAPDRLYVRAFARTQTLSAAWCTGTSADALRAQRRGQCIERIGFTNPVWATKPRGRFADVVSNVGGGVLTR
jgi:hypothetical protein